MKRSKNWQPKLVSFEHEPMNSESKDAPNHGHEEPAKSGFRRWSQKAKDMGLAIRRLTNKHSQ
jgi:hypothetical protein